MVPTSAITGDGMGDLIALLVTFSLKMLTQQLMLSMELEALVLEVGSDELVVSTCSAPPVLSGQGHRWSGDNHRCHPTQWCAKGGGHVSLDGH